jgi:hypothetical protein
LEYIYCHTTGSKTSTICKERPARGWGGRGLLGGGGDDEDFIRDFEQDFAMFEKNFNENDSADDEEDEEDDDDHI